MPTYHVQQRFHAAGHGTFLTGLFLTDHQPFFSWVYDCGSRRAKPLDDAMDMLKKSSLWPDPIDMLVLSHFDDDHVNRIEKLLTQRKVKCLVLPFSEWQQRLREVVIGGKKGVSPSTALLQLDPVGWLEALGLSERVKTIMLVQGGSPDPDALPLDPMPLPTEPNPNLEAFDPTDKDAVRMRSELALGQKGKNSSVEIKSVSHRTPMRARTLPMEFMFYNAEISGPDLDIIKNTASGLVAKKSGLALAAVRTQVETAIGALGLIPPFSKLPPDWRQQLKECYEMHFGSTSEAKNNISLCMHVRPLPSQELVERCCIFPSSDSTDVQITDHSFHVFDYARPAVLYTGDLALDATVIAAMKTHFGPTRWQQTGVTQVPHHGSQHSWEAGNASLLAPSAFVHCAPGSAAHPHPSVVADLKTHAVFTADYASSVTLDYHFN